MELRAQRLRSPPVAEHFDAWVFGIARNAALDLMQRRARAERSVELDEAGGRTVASRTFETFATRGTRSTERD
jgi:DNA-directed RNA polymerase specialized sigma24 family protein